MFFGVAQSQVPGAPTNLLVTPFNAGGEIQFNAPSSSVASPITNYEYSTDNGATWVTPSPAVTASPLVISSGLTNCTSYQVKIRALNASGSGTASASATLIPLLSIDDRGTTWVSRTASIANNWRCVTYGNGLFVAVAASGTGNRVMTSPDGINWTTRNSPADFTWSSVTYGNGLFVAVAQNGLNGTSVMTSQDGISWTLGSLTSTTWHGVTFGNGRFVAVAESGAVVTSDNGTTWTSSTPPGAITNPVWHSVTYGNGRFVAVARSASSTGNRAMTSQDGINWTAGNTTLLDNNWRNVTYGNGLFVAVARSASSNASRVMTSINGTDWIPRTPASNTDWFSVTYGNGLFVAVGNNSTGVLERVMTSPDGINWTAQTSAAQNSWQSVTYANGIFVAVSNDGGNDRVMTSSFSLVANAPVITSATLGSTTTVNFTQTSSAYATAISNYEYSTNDGIDWTALSPADNLSPVTINGLSTVPSQIRLRAVNSIGNSCFSNNYTVIGGWTGASSTDWNNSSNWTSSIVPDNSSSVRIPTGRSNYPVLTGAVSLSELILESGSSINLSSNNLTLSGNLTNNGTITGSGKLVMSGTSTQTFSGAGTVHNIEINKTSGVISISSGSSNKMYVTGLYTPTSGVLTTNGNLVFRSTATQEGVVGTAGICPTEPISGDVTVEKYIPAKRAFRFLTPGVTTSTTINANWQEGRSVSSTAGYPYAGGTTENPISEYGTHIMGTGGSTNGFDASLSNSSSLYTFDVSSYAWVAEANTNVSGNVLKRGEAYRLFVRGDRGVNLNTDAEAATATTIRTTGVLKVCESMSFTTTSPVVPLSSVAGRYSFIGNPYWSVVDWHAVTKTNVEDNLYYWDPTISGTNGRGAYITYNALTSSNNTQGSVANRYIQPGQAFFVRNNSDVSASNLPSITFDHADIVGSSPTRTAIFGKKNNISVGGELGMDDQQRVRGTVPLAIEKIYVSLLIKNKVAAGPADGFLVAYNQGFTDTYGKEDASKFSNLDENIAAVYNGSRQSILGLQSASGNQIKTDTIPISMSNLYDGEYLLKVSIDKSVSPVREVYVVNRVTKQQYKVDYTKGLELSFLNSITKTKDDLVLVVNSQSIPNPVRTRKQLVVFPNPVTTGTVEVIVPNISGKNDMMNKPARIEVFSSNNQVVFTQNVTLDATGKATLDFSSLTSGGYVVRVYLDRNSFTTKLIKP